MTAPSFRIFKSPVGTHLLVLARSQVFDLSPDFAASVERAEPEALRAVDELALGAADPTLDLVPEPPPQSISLNVTSSCNLGCDYCYAERGGFGGAQRGAMTFEAAAGAVDRLLEVCD